MITYKTVIGKRTMITVISENNNDKSSDTNMLKDNNSDNKRNNDNSDGRDNARSPTSLSPAISVAGTATSDSCTRLTRPLPVLAWGSSARVDHGGSRNIEVWI